MDDIISILNFKTESYLLHFQDLDLSKKKIDSKYNGILEYYLREPDDLPLNCFNANSDKFKNIQNVYRYTDELCSKLKILELVTHKQKQVKGTKSKITLPYRLSLNGLFYIVNYPPNISESSLIELLIKNYSSNAFLTLFVYPIINKQTLLEIIIDTSISQSILNYLRNICDALIKNLSLLRKSNSQTDTTSSDGYLIHHLFYWPAIPISNDNSFTLFT